MRELFLTFFYSGRFPKAPGTVGTLAGAAVAVPIVQYLSLETLFLGALLLAIIGIKQIDAYEAAGGPHDDKSIVIDEVVGVWIALSISSGTLAQWVFSIVLFRVFDIWKPSVIGRIDKHVKGGLGVMGDDVIAGVIAGLCSSMLFGVMLKFGLA
ncbi:phosphatidylglycerophosphatase A [Sulfurospirillum sp. T05]|uniref:Phosphatidylglycerophosphatase A n=1 Tax=Sulfurospirillum tamanense TaxID=2813362 RepID=A0ABS2WTP7_9BACT|nr:phosphatidylglycerophosphatase A [Sulfurospirillum tamanensis]MBN2965020.1 phosphatidylglycerophosphatase A [Sulfurospirillum tamanensis]